jgi:Fe-S cluster assembly ATP-binding protein
MLKKLDIQKEFLTRNFNQGFSGGEKKKNEILQMLLLKPKLIILDEIDSGLDLDTLKIISKILNCYIGTNIALLIITHNPKILDYIYPNYLHIMINGKIIKTGKKALVTELKNKGYSYV